MPRFRSSMATVGISASLHHVLPQKPIFDVTPPPVSDAMGDTDGPPTEEDNSTLEFLNYCFSIPFSFIPGPDPDQIIAATSRAKQRWLYRLSSPPNPPTSRLPVHQKSIDDLKELCRTLSRGSQIRTTVSVTEPPVESSSRKKQSSVATLWLAGEPEEVLRVRGLVLHSVPVAMVCRIH